MDQATLVAQPLNGGLELVNTSHMAPAFWRLQAGEQGAGVPAGQGQGSLLILSTLSVPSVLRTYCVHN